ncbi:MAG: N-acetyltransferase [Candidatus Omnitrophota bacterium]
MNNLRKARIKDAQAIHAIVNSFAKKDLMMPRSLNEIFEHIRDYWVVSGERGQVIGCAALHVVGWDDLAELKSLAVERKYQGKGLGALLVKACLKEAQELDVRKCFTLSYQPEFFKKLGFKVTAKSRLPHKVWAECCQCPKFPDCGETALIQNIQVK